MFDSLKLFLIAGAIALTSMVPRSGLANDVVLQNNPASKISHIKSFILNYGVNDVTFWGTQNFGQNPALIVHQHGIIVRTNSGHPADGNFDVYFAVSGRIKPIFNVYFTDSGELFLTSIPDAGQSQAFGVRYFNGLWNGHCQTFAVSDNRKIDEQSGSVSSNISVYYFEPGIVENDGTSNAAQVFSLLRTYRGLNSDPDPDIVISKEFSLPLPHEYYAMTFRGDDHPGEYAAELSKKLSLPKETHDNSYYPSEPDKGC